MINDDSWLDAIDDKTAPHLLKMETLEQLVHWYECSQPLSISHGRRLRKLKETLLRKKIRHRVQKS